MSRCAHDDFLTRPGGRNASKQESAEDKDTKYTGRWTSCKLLPHSLNGSELSTLRSGQRTAHVHTAIQRTSGWYNFNVVFPIVAADRATRLHRIQRERAYARHTVVLQETLECAAQRQGFKAIYMTPFGTAAAHGFPDLDQTLARSVDISVICDADTGYDEAINVQRTVREYEDRREAIWPK